MSQCRCCCCRGEGASTSAHVVMDRASHVIRKLPFSFRTRWCCLRQRRGGVANDRLNIRPVRRTSLYRIHSKIFFRALTRPRKHGTDLHRRSTYRRRETILVRHIAGGCYFLFRGGGGGETYVFADVRAVRRRIRHIGAS